MGRPRGSKNKPKESESVVSGDVAAEETPIVKNEDEQPLAAPPAHKNRFALLNEIHETNKERQVAEEDGDEVNEEDETPPEDDAVGTAPEDQALEKEPEVPAVAATETPPKKLKLVIDGVEKELNESEVIALAQKAGAVDSRLAQATRILEDAKRKAATPSGADDAAIHRDGGRSGQPSSPGDVDPTLIEEISDAVIYGDKDQITQAIRKLMTTGRQPATPGITDPAQIQRYVSETIAFESAKRLLDTPPDQGGFNDIYGDPMLRRMFEAREDELRTGKPDQGVLPDQRPYSELYKSIATELREWRDGIVKAHSKPTGLEKRDQLKRSAGIVRGNGGRAPTHAETPPMTHEDKLAAMRRSRGLN